RRHTSWRRDWSSDVCSSDLRRNRDNARKFCLLFMKRVATKKNRGVRAPRPLCCAPRTTHSARDIPVILFGEAPKRASEALALTKVEHASSRESVQRSVVAVG